MIKQIDKQIELCLNSTKGKKSLDYEKFVIEKMNNNWGKYDISFIETDKKSAARIDHIIIKNNKVAGLIEIKCREIELNDFIYQYGNKVMITLQKLKDGMLMSEMLCVPFILAIFLVPDQIILYWKITDSYGKQLIPFEIKKFETPASCIGGTAIRENAFIQYKHSKVLYDKNNLLKRNDT